MDTAVIPASRRTAQRLVELAQKRIVLQQLRSIAQRLPDLTTEELAGELIEPAVAINLDGSTKHIFSSSELATRAAELQEERRAEPGLIRGIRTNFPALDLTLRGQRSGCMTFIVGPTGLGKSTLGLNLNWNVARQGIPTLLISTENNSDENLDRLSGIITGRNISEIESGRHAADVSGQVGEALAETPFFLSDNRPRTIQEVVGTITRYALRHGVRYVTVDYIAEISTDSAGPRNESEEQRLARWAQMLLDAARMLDIHIVLLGQLNRSGNMRGRPTKTEIAGSFKIAQKSVSVLILWQSESGLDLLSIDKNRQGAGKTDIALKFTRQNQRISELGFWLEKEDGRIVPPSNAKANLPDFVDLDAVESE
jgi:replicative DNA helicase